jgi:hydrogenase/urease accessory protein HupE
MRAAVLLLAAACLGYAHDIARTESKLDVRGDEVRAGLLINLSELKGISIPFDGTGRITPAQLDGIIGPVFTEVRSHYSVLCPDEPADTHLDQYVLIDGHAVHLEFRYRFSHPVETITVTSRLHEIMGPGHQHLLSLTLNGTAHEVVLDAQSPSVTFTGAATTRLDTFWRFGKLGVEHILTGYDHLAFLLGLLVVTASIGSLVRIVTSFTIAHSITLALATLNIVVLPTRLTESAIALSILYVAIENIMGFRAVKRYYITFLFGLIHGFGFSNVLREMDLPRSGLALSLFSFNFGVEVGQLAFVLLVFPAVRDLIQSGWTRLSTIVSATIGCLAAWWFIERAFFG